MKRAALIVVVLVVLAAAAWPVEANWKNNCNYASAKSPAVTALISRATDDHPPFSYGRQAQTMMGCAPGSRD